jgi:hypothetical protein
MTLDIFREFASLQICKVDSLESLGSSINQSLFKREPTSHMEMDQDRPMKKHSSHRERGGDNFKKGGGRVDTPSDPWKREDNQEKLKLKQQAAKFKQKIGGDKNTEQKIRLILNVISPDNMDKKLDELRTYLMPEFKSKLECEAAGETYDEEQHKLTDENLDLDMVKVAVSNLVRKAQTEREYCIFYGQVTQQIIRTEIELRGFEATFKNKKVSKIRLFLIEEIKTTFNTFIDQETREKSRVDLDRQLKFQERMFGNIEFAGELFRRKILPKEPLFSIFEALLKCEEPEVENDLSVEASVNLINKVGLILEQQYSEEKSKKGNSDFVQRFEGLMERFQTIQSDPKVNVSQRMRLITKNMLANRESGWEKTEKMNTSGPKTKKEVQEEVLRKHQAQFE